MRSSPRRVASGVDVDGKGRDPVKDPMARRETLELVRAYYSMEDTSLRKRAADIVKSIAAALSKE